MSKRHKPVTKAQIGLLLILRKFAEWHGNQAWWRTNLQRDFMLAAALRKKGLIITRWIADHDMDGEPYNEGYEIQATRKGVRYLRFINSLYYCASCGAVNWTPSEPCKCGNIAVRKGR